METIEKLQQLILSEQGFAQFFALLQHEQPPEQEYFFQQVSFTENMPQFAPEGSLQVQSKEHLNHEEQYALGMCLLAVSGKLRGQKVSVWPNILRYCDWSSSGISGLLLTKAPPSNAGFIAINTLESLFLGDISTFPMNLDLQALTALKHVQFLNAQDIPLSLLPRALETIQLFHAKLKIDIDWGDFTQLESIRFGKEKPSVLPQCQILETTPVKKDLPTWQLIPPRRVHPDDKAFVYEKVEPIIKKQGITDKIKTFLQEYNWQCHQHTFPKPTIYQFTEAGEEIIFAAYTMQPQTWAFCYHRPHQKERTLVLFDTQQKLTDYKERFAQHSEYICKTFPLQSMSITKFIETHGTHPVLTEMMDKVTTEARLIDVTYPWGGNFVEKIRPMLERGLGLYSFNDPVTEGSDCYGIYFSPDDAVMTTLQYWLSMDVRAKDATEWEWYETCWKDIAGALATTEAVGYLNTDWKHFEVELDFLEPIGYCMEKLHGAILQNSEKLRFSLPNLSEYTAPSQWSKKNMVWQVSQYRIAPKN